MSTDKDSKNIYRIAREEMDLTRDEVCDKIPFLSNTKLQRIEDPKSSTVPKPEDVIAMAELYNKPELINYYCTKECAIGKSYVPEITTSKALSEIVLEMIHNINKVNKYKEELIDITVDSKISDDEIERYVVLEDSLEKMELTIQYLKYWVEKNISSGKINKSKLDAYRKAIKEK